MLSDSSQIALTFCCRGESCSHLTKIRELLSPLFPNLGATLAKVRAPLGFCMKSESCSHLASHIWMLSSCSHLALTLLSPAFPPSFLFWTRSESVSPCSHLALTLLSPCSHLALTLLPFLGKVRAALTLPSGEELISHEKSLHKCLCSPSRFPLGLLSPFLGLLQQNAFPAFCINRL